MKKLLTILFAVALGLNLSAQTACPPAQDANQDGVIGVDDLMDLLSHWGDTDFDFDGVYDSVDLCTDEGACNYLSNPTEACLYLDAIGACGGDCVEDTDGDGVCDPFYGPCQGESTVTYQDYTYNLVAIGDQCWFAENLRSTHYQNGDVIPTMGPSPWSNTNVGSTSLYGGEVGQTGWWYCESEYATFDPCDDPVLTLEEFGRLYNGYAIQDTRGTCPVGWHVPTMAEYSVLIDFVEASGFEGMTAAALRTNEGWAFEEGEGILGSDNFNFGAKAAGNRAFNGFWYGSGKYANFAFYNEEEDLLGLLQMSKWENETWFVSNSDPVFGRSVRCIKD